MPMNILRKLSTLIRAMASRGTDERAAERVSAPLQARDADVEQTAAPAQQTHGERAEVQRQPLDRSRVADLLERQQAPDEDAPAQRKKGDRS
jgi:hypothetical protein